MASVSALENAHFIFILLLVFQVKHFVADYPLQRRYMLLKGRSGWDFVLPLSAHCGVHAFTTLLIVAFTAPDLYWLAGVDFVSHFIMDRLKSGPRYLGRFNDRDRATYWYCFGFDQMFHHVTNYFIIYQIWLAQ